jgi:hypothetical protein
VEVEIFFEEIPLGLVILIFKDLNGLPEEQTYCLDFPLTMAIVNGHIKFDNFIRKEEDLVELGADEYLEIRGAAPETALVLHVALELEVLIGETLDALGLNIVDLQLFLVLHQCLLPIRHIRNPL